MTRQHNGGDYFRLLYFSARPEDGEKVCVAVLVRVGMRWFVEFDEHFSKLRAVAADSDIDLVRGVIDILQVELDSSDILTLMAGIEPQFRISESRKLLLPWTKQVRYSLRKRFLFRRHFREGDVEREHEEKTQAQIKEILDEILPRAREFATPDFRPSQIFGESLAKELRMRKPIAQAFIGRTRAVLIDGVDTTLKPSSQVIRKANRIAFTFWQLGKALGNRTLPPPAPLKIFRVGIVFNGHPDSHTLREYTLHQFEKDADLAVESANRQGLYEMKVELESTIADMRL